MAVNIVKYGGSTVMDASGATATAATICEGYTAMIKTGAVATGTAKWRKVVSVTLPVSGWSGNTQTVSCSGVTADNTVIVDGSASSEYVSYGVYCSGQAAGKLTFTCESTPTSSLTVSVCILI